MPPIILGPMGNFPQGKLNDQDEGGLQMAVGVENGKIILAFGTPVAWVGLDAPAARTLALALLARVNEIQPEGL